MRTPICRHAWICRCLPTGMVWQGHPQSRGHEGLSATEAAGWAVDTESSLPLLTNHLQFLLWGPEFRPKQMGRKKNPHIGMGDKGNKISLDIFSFNWQTLDTTHRFGMSDMVPAETAQHRGCRWSNCFSQVCYHYKHVSLLQSYLVLVLISPNKGNITKIPNKIIILLLILLLYFPNPVIYCDQRPVTNILFGQSCLHSFFNCIVTREKYITLPMFLTSYIIEENKLRLKITEEPHTRGWGEQKNQQKN